ncbi:MAG: dCTP deaminase domain-containing protein [Allosphingosinicella sp.]
MAVIHIRGRVTADEQKFDENALSDKSFLLLDRPQAPENFSVELTLGEGWSEKYSRTNNHMHRIAADEKIEIRRNGSIVVEVAEHIRVPHNMYGIVVPTGSLFLDRGVIIAAAKVEPSFEGRLKLRLVNTTDRKVFLAAGDKVASIIFFATEVTKHQPTVEKRAYRDSKPPGWSKRAARWLAANYQQMITWLVTAAFGAVSAMLLARYLAPEAAPPAVDAPAPPPAPLPTEGQGIARRLKQPAGNSQ